MLGFYTEADYENSIIELLQNMGYRYIYGPDVERDYHSPLYEDILLPCLRRVNPTLPMDALNEAVYQLKNFENGTLLQKNMTFMDYLQNGVPVKYFVSGEERSTQIPVQRRDRRIRGIRTDQKLYARNPHSVHL